MAKIRSEIDWSHLLFGIIPDALWRAKSLIDGRSTIDYQFVSQKLFRDKFWSRVAWGVVALPNRSIM